MKVYVSADFEGISGVVHPSQVLPDGRFYEEARRLFVEEVNAAVRGAFNAGATSVTVNDAHDTMRNLMVARLDPRAAVVLGGFKRLSMLEGIDSSFGAAIFLGYHAMGGTADSVLDHTFCPKEVTRLWINGAEAGEIAVNAFLAGYYGVPVVLVTGDSGAVGEAGRCIPGTRVLAVKKGLGRFCAECIAPELSRELIYQATRDALSQPSFPSPLIPPSPVRFKVELATTAMADVACLIPEVEREDARTIRFEHEDYVTAYQLLRASLILAGHAYEGEY